MGPTTKAVRRPQGFEEPLLYNAAAKFPPLGRSSPVRGLRSRFGASSREAVRRPPRVEEPPPETMRAVIPDGKDDNITMRLVIPDGKDDNITMRLDIPGGKDDVRGYSGLLAA